MQFFREYQEVFSQIQEDTLVLTPNQRLSRFIQSQYSLWQTTQANTTWVPLRCTSLQLWLSTLWQDIQIAGEGENLPYNLMSPAQERILWLQAIEANMSDGLLSVESMADIAIQAWRNLRMWGKSLGDLSVDCEEVNLFKAWVTSFCALRAEKRLLDETDITLEILKSLDEKAVKVPSSILCVGFDELAPAIKGLIDSLKSTGVHVAFRDIQIPAFCQRIELPDTQTEVETIARWSANIVEENAKSTVGIVIPDLANMRPMVERIFTSVFEPQYILPNKPRHAPAFNISAAQPLAQTQLISTAILALQLNNKEMSCEDIYKLLTVPFLGVAAEHKAHIYLLRTLQEQYVRIPFSAIRTCASETCSNLYKMLQAFDAEIKSKKNKRLKCSDWANIFGKQIETLGWPGQRELDTLEFQQLAHWPELLAELSKLDRVLPVVDISRAMSELNKLAYIPFHAQTSDSPVQVLGMLEAAGQQFDYMWVMGLDYRTWPEASSPNPLIPVCLQKEWAMPRSSMEKELAVAQRLTSRLSSSASQVIFSSPLVDGDQPLRPSPLISSLPCVEAKHLTQFEGENYLNVLLSGAMESIEDTKASKVMDTKSIRGGSQILKNQSACAFRAFAKHRLIATSPEYMQEGVSALVRGNLVHNALEKIWGELETQERLKGMSGVDLGSLIEEAVSNAWFELRDAKGIGERMKTVECLRTNKLIHKWLELEKTRAPFRVKYHEKAVEFYIADMPLKIRYDRMDELLETGELIVLDYKTGNVDINLWASERPDDPQVPLYCLSLLQKPLVAAVLAQINVKEVAAKGIAVSKDIIKGLKTPDELKKIDLPDEWVEIKQYWKQNLEQLAQAFVDGDAQVKPKSLVKTCQFCDIRSLCRIGSKGGEQ